jgi:hypothetical protein
MRPSVMRLAISARTALSELYKGDRVAVAGFDTQSYLYAGLNGNLEEVAHKVGDVVDVSFEGGTHILSAIDDAATYMRKNAGKQGRRAILVMTDDEGQYSMREKKVVDDLWEADTLVCGLIIPNPRSAGAPIGLGPAEVMLGVADKTGGETVDANEPGHAFREMIRRMRQRYTVYYEMPTGKAGTARKVSLDVSDAVKSRYPGVQVLARKGYVIPK